MWAGQIMVVLWTIIGTLAFILNELRRSWRVSNTGMTESDLLLSNCVENKL
jgi:hypothetical protein